MSTEGPNDEDIEGLIWLLKACKLGDSAVASQVLSIKPSIRQVTYRQTGLTPLLGALAYYKEGCPQSLFRELVQAPTPLNAQQTEGWGAIHFLARQNRTDLLAIFLEQYGVNINSLTTKGESALMIAAWDGHADVVRMLLAHGADCTIPNLVGQLPIHKACIEAHFACVEQLLKKEPNTKMAEDPQGRTPLHYLAQTKSTHQAAVAAITALFSTTELAKECRDDVTPLEMAHYFRTQAAAHIAPKQLLSLYQLCQNELCQKLDKATFQEVLPLLPSLLQETLEKKKSRTSI
jgi:hypothetical protein